MVGINRGMHWSYFWTHSKDDDPYVISFRRRRNDFIAVAVHAALLALLLGKTLPNPNLSQTFLIAIEAISCVYHLGILGMWVYYTDRIQGYTNWGKWIEYALTATLGTLATGVSAFRENGIDTALSEHLGWLMALAILGFTQQMSGLSIELSYPSETITTSKQITWALIVYAFASQIAEFAIVAHLRAYGTDNVFDVASVAYWVYVVMWLSFGNLCTARSIAVLNPTWAPEWLYTLTSSLGKPEQGWSTDLSEAFYSCLGWVSKFAVAISIIYEQLDPGAGGAFIVIVGTSLAVYELAVLTRLAWQNTFNGGKDESNVGIPDTWRHGVAAMVHVVSGVVLLVAAAQSTRSYADYNKLFWVKPSTFKLDARVWYWDCAVQLGAECPDDQKVFHVIRPDDAKPAYILWLATFYVFWSAGQHAGTQWVGWDERVARWVDYTFTAPVMLAVIAIIFGADNALAVIIAPLVLAVLLVVSAMIERQSGERPRKHTVILLGLLGAYAATWVPIFYAVDSISTDKDIDTRGYDGIGTAPKGIVTGFSVSMMIAFTSFAGVFVYDAFWVASNREVWYIALSMISKTSLHLFLGLTVIQQAQTIGSETVEAPNDSDMDTLATGLVGTLAIVIVCGSVHAAMIPKTPPLVDNSALLID